MFCHVAPRGCGGGDGPGPSNAGTPLLQLWVELCELLSAHPDKVTSVNAEAIIRAGLRRFPDVTGALWQALAAFYIRLGNAEKVRGRGQVPR